MENFENLPTNEIKQNANSVHETFSFLPTNVNKKHSPFGDLNIVF